MTKEEFLNIKTYEEFDKRRSEMADVDFSDPEIRDHLDSLFPKVKSSGFEKGIIYEAYPNKK